MLGVDCRRRGECATYLLILIDLGPLLVSTKDFRTVDGF